MRAALRLFSTKGYGHVGIREIALEAGVSTAALYHYMRTKEDLLVFLMSDRMRRITEVGTRARGEFEDPARQLAALVRIHVIAHGRFPDEVVDREVRSLSPEGKRIVVALRDQYEHFWDEVLEAGIRSGGFEVPSVRFTRLALLEMCGGVAQWYRPSGDSPLGQIADAYADLALAMVRARDGHHPLRVADLDLPPAQHHADLVGEVYAELAADGRASRARP